MGKSVLVLHVRCFITIPSQIRGPDIGGFMCFAALSNPRKRRGILSSLSTGLACCIVAFASVRVHAQSVTFAGNAQHTSIYAPPAQSLNTIKWSTTIDFNNTGAL